jgi:hypothetical protein
MKSQTFLVPQLDSSNAAQPCVNRFLPVANPPVTGESEQKILFRT